MTRQDDTIAAVATPPGAGGIGIVKISGPGALGVAEKLFRASREGRNLAPRRLHHGFIVDPATREGLDEVLVSFMAAPRSYTGEDVVEINCHSGPAALRRVLDLVLSSGARMAEPGEFTRRAFLNGRIDLVRAEAVAELVAARSTKALALAAAQIEGALSEELAAVRTTLLGVLMELEASIDFSDDDIETAEPRDIIPPLEEAVLKIERLISTFEAGRLFREGYTVVIAGRPNVGKSSLLNAFLGRDRAIVTEVPGTTRDIIEEVVEMGSLPVRLVDTAGIAEPGGPVDREGIRRALAAAGAADLVLWLLDGGEGVRGDDFTVKEEIKGFPRIAVVNKADLPPALPPEDFAGRVGEEVMFVSAKEGTGLDGLREAITERALGDLPEPPEADFAVNARHHRELLTALDGLKRALEGLSKGLSPELTALDVKEGLAAVERVLGLSLTGDVLDMIFSRFCVGK